jgi:hypothetical protein
MNASVVGLWFRSTVLPASSSSAMACNRRVSCPSTLQRGRDDSRAPCCSRRALELSPLAFKAGPAGGRQHHWGPGTQGEPAVARRLGCTKVVARVSR